MISDSVIRIDRIVASPQAIIKKGLPADSEFKEIEEWGDMSGYFLPKDIPMAPIHDKNIRAAIDEYGGTMDDFITGRQLEKTSGHYTKSDYDYINEKAWTVRYD